MLELIRKKIADKSVVLLGFGREGQSSYSVLRRVFPDKLIQIADISEAVAGNPILKNDPNVRFITGPAYLEKLNAFDFIFRSPGIPVWKIMSDAQPSGLRIQREKITSQTELFLQAYAPQVIGVTGTKGKSTTSGLIHHILKTAGAETILVGNIGSPAFHFIDLIKPETKIVFELSSHQLEFITKAPHIAILLNLFQEHLDAYPDLEAYLQAKINITKFQEQKDILVYNMDEKPVMDKLKVYLDDRECRPFSVQSEPAVGGYIHEGWACYADEKVRRKVWKIHQDRFLRGEHNLKNILAAMNVAMALEISVEFIEDGIASFKGLEHRLEYLGEFHGIHFYNDSIATIPEACMEALKAVPDVDTLIAGGFDRGIDYEGLADFIRKSEVRKVILTGAAGKRLGEEVDKGSHPNQQIYYINRFDDFCNIALRETRPGHACLLSPAAASYDEFNNFEERGKRFRELVKSFLIVFVCLLGFSSFSQKVDFATTVQNYVGQFSEVAIQEMMIYRIPASITLAQGIIESRAGQSRMAIEANNHFGIKCHKEWLGKTFYQEDDTPNDCFRKYDSPQESFRDHSYFLTQRERYRGLFKLDLSDYRGWAQGLQSAGYATNPAYAEILIRTIEKYGLSQYDKGNFTPVLTTDDHDFSNLAWLKNLEVFGEGPNHRTVYVNNQLQLTIVRQGDNIDRLAKDFGVSSRRLKKFNDLPAYGSLLAGQIIYLEPKRRNGASTAHIVRNGESLHQISQLYGVKLKVLQRRNNLQPGMEVSAGKVLRLR